MKRLREDITLAVLSILLGAGLNLLVTEVLFK